jgi:hypothetical protein
MGNTADTDRAPVPAGRPLRGTRGGVSCGVVAGGLSPSTNLPNLPAVPVSAPDALVALQAAVLGVEADWVGREMREWTKGRKGYWDDVLGVGAE